MKSFLITVFLLTQISIAWSLFKISESANAKEISIFNYLKKFFAGLKKIFKYKIVKAFLVLLFLSILIFITMAIKGCMNHERRNKTFNNSWNIRAEELEQKRNAFKSEYGPKTITPDMLPSRRRARGEL